MNDGYWSDFSSRNQQSESAIGQNDLEMAFCLIQEIDPEVPDDNLHASVASIISRLQQASIDNHSSSIEKSSPESANHELERIKWLVAGNPNSPPRLLALLAKGAVTGLLQKIAENPRTPAITLAELASHCESDVRAAVAENTNTPEEGLWRLILDECPDVRFSLAENYHLSLEMLDLLTEDDNPYVSFRARKTLSRMAPSPPIEGTFGLLDEQQQRKQS